MGSGPGPRDSGRLGGARPSSGLMGCSAAAEVWVVGSSPPQNKGNRLLDPGRDFSSGGEGGGVPGPGSIECVWGVQVGVEHPFVCVFMFDEWV